MERARVSKMADGAEGRRKEKIDAVRRDFDEFFDEIKEKNKNYKYEDGLNLENLEEELENIPLFMQNIPEEIDPEKSPALAALQALKYELDTPEARAEAYKEDGNIQYKKKEFKTAIKNYTEGIKIKCEDKKLNAILYTNRATAQAYLGNNRSALNDAKAALTFDPDYMKAVIRGATACTELKLHDDALQWIDKGLAIEPQNTKLLELRTRSVNEKDEYLNIPVWEKRNATEQWKKQQERDRRKQQAKKKKEREKNDALISAIRAAGVTLEERTNQHALKDEELCDKISQCFLEPSDSPTGHVVHLDETGTLHWPVMFLYPEYGQSDFVSDFNECHRFEEQLQVVLADFPPWDIHRRFSLPAVEIYFEGKEGEMLHWVNKTSSLRDVLKNKKLVVRSATPSFILLAKGSPFTDSFCQRYRSVNR